MNTKRFFFVMVGVLSLLVISNVGAVVVGNAILQGKSARLNNFKLDSRVLDEQQNSLNQAKKDIEKYNELVKIAKAVVPQDKDQAEAVREIVKIATDNGIILSTISFPASTLGQAAPKVTTPTDSSTPAPKVTTAPVTQVLAVEGIPGVFSLQITIQQDASSPITYNKFISFLGSLEQNRRTAQVSNVTVQPNPQDRSLLTFSLTVNAYIKP